MTVHRVLPVAFCLFALTCVIDRQPTTPDLVSPPAEIVDATHNGGNRYFFFLPPFVAQPTFSGTFDPSLSPVVEICEWTGAACALPIVARFTTTTGPGSETVRLDLPDSLYIV